MSAAETPEEQVARIMAERDAAPHAKPKHAGGRPTKYDAKAHPIAAAALAGLGLTEQELAHELGVSTTTLDNWKAKYPEFSGALKAAKVVPDEEVEQALFKRATGEQVKSRTFVAGREVIEYHASDTTACIFWLCNRRPDRWRHVNRVEVTGADGGPMQVEHLTETELDREIARLVADLGVQAAPRGAAAREG